MSDYVPINVSRFIRNATEEFGIGENLFSNYHIRHTLPEGNNGFRIADWQRILYILATNFPNSANTAIFGMGGSFYGNNVVISRQTFLHRGFTYRFGFDGRLSLAFILNVSTGMRRYIYDPNELSHEFSLDEQVPPSRVLSNTEIQTLEYDQ